MIIMATKRITSWYLENEIKNHINNYPLFTKPKVIFVFVDREKTDNVVIDNNDASINFRTINGIPFIQIQYTMRLSKEIFNEIFQLSTLRKIKFTHE